MAYLAGHIITGARWIGRNAIAVTFTASSDGFYRQLYAGKQLIGVTGNPGDREVVGQLVASEYPQDLSLVAVNASERFTNYGDGFGVGAWNKIRLRVSTSSYASDADRLEITAGTEPSGAVDAANILGQIVLEGDATYEFITQPMGPSGTWNIEATPYDDKPDGGNSGTALATSVDLLARPRDVALQSDGSRLFGVSISAQTLNLSVTIP